MAVKAVSALSTYLSGSGADPKREEVVEEVRDLVLELESDESGDEARRGEEAVVRVVAGTVFVLQGEKEEAVATLTEGAAKTDLEW